RPPHPSPPPPPPPPLLAAPPPPPRVPPPRGGGGRPNYRLRHLDADSNVAEREEAKAELAAASSKEPRGIFNVGIFGEGTDAPNLSAVGFLEPRKSPVDVIQAVGRVMRRSRGKQMGYIICPIVIPKNAVAETWMADTEHPDDGWQELGQILMALRSHDPRIEYKLSELMEVYLPSDYNADKSLPIATVVGLVSVENKISYFLHEGNPGEAQAAATDCVENGIPPSKRGMRPLNDAYPNETVKAKQSKGLIPPSTLPKQEPIAVITARPVPNLDPEAPIVVELRQSSVVRGKSKSDGYPGPINIDKTKKKARKMANGYEGRKIKPSSPKDKLPRQEQLALRLLEKSNAEQMGIFVNLLEKSGLCRSKSAQSVNLLQQATEQACFALRQDELELILAKHFRISHEDNGADACTIASLLLMNAAMLHQRAVAGNWLANVNTPLSRIKSAPNAIRLFRNDWNRIAQHDFLPVIKPALEIIEVVEECGRESGLNSALRHLAGEAEKLAAQYADMGADYAGELFNKVMGNQSSDGAFFTRPTAAALL
ncbi:MAG: hypothetical protein OXD01_14895, partial [Gammaproteobacteria bacterium]|nr:hypothetical protein [Gammaproteobacteria bacterium]